MARWDPPEVPAVVDAAPVDLEVRWRHLRWFGRARDPDDGPLDHHRLVDRLDRAGVPLPEAVTQVEALLAATGLLAAFERFHDHLTNYRNTLTRRRT